MKFFKDEEGHCCVEWDLGLGNSTQSLRTTFHIEDGEWLYQVTQKDDGNVIYHNLSSTLFDWRVGRWVVGEGYSKLLSYDTVWHQGPIITQQKKNGTIERFKICGFDTPNCLFLFEVLCDYWRSSVYSSFEALPYYCFSFIDKKDLSPSEIIGTKFRWDTAYGFGSWKFYDDVLDFKVPFHIRWKDYLPCGGAPRNEVKFKFLSSVDQWFQERIFQFTEPVDQSVYDKFTNRLMHYVYEVL